MSPYLAELVGTALLIVLGGGVCANVNLKKSYAHGAGWLVINIGWGLAVTFAVYATGQFSGAHLNPAVTLGLAFNGDFLWSQVFGYIVAQMIGAIIGATIVYFHFLPHWKVTEDPGTKLGVFATGPAIPHTFANLMSEFIGTFVLVLGILTIGANKFADGLNPFIVGLLIVAIGVSLGGTTGYAINPARDLGPRIAHFILPIPGKGSSNWKYAWIPVVGPMLGGSFAGLFYQAVFIGNVVPAFWGVLVVSIIVFIIASMMTHRQAKLTLHQDSI
ncbi:glycerol uptake facilitator protein [Oikeobacillus pervagus]|uniref:Glycerol uptake facilitator protein n=1 Tax=Oikeobacillus pervagus TaxID=1325931 RepID=A0AAJ1SY84_9BACI|nr:MIP/aquaporin family protein [Oikeobacillus pervagus]MDQ0214694.1 glycerol uptake facilitator protein [Oikeobacillus pervagus]